MIDYPKTFQEAEQARYGAWAGHPSGNRYERGRCAYEVWTDGRGAIGSQCGHKNGYGSDKLYCKVHAQKLGMIEAPKPKPRRKSFESRLIDSVNGLKAENTRLLALLRRALVHCDISTIEGARTLYDEIQEALKE